MVSVEHYCKQVDVCAQEVNEDLMREDDDYRICWIDGVFFSELGHHFLHLFMPEFPKERKKIPGNQEVHIT